MTHAIYPLIVAAGKGNRFGSTLAKQYQPMGYTDILKTPPKTVLQHSIERLAKSPLLIQKSQGNPLTLVIAPDDTIAPTLDFALPIHLTTGGAERWQSVQAGVNAIVQLGAQADDWVFIHDAVRPAVCPSKIDQLIDQAENEPFGAILAIPIVDTVKKAVQNLPQTAPYIECTLDRRELWLAQTPQMFRLAKLQQVLVQISEQNLDITDEAAAFEHFGHPIRLVEGNRQNLKLTYPEDLLLLNHIVLVNFCN